LGGKFSDKKGFQYFSFNVIVIGFEDGERMRCKRVVRVKGMLTDSRLFWVSDGEACSVRNSPVLTNTEVELEGSLPNVDSITTVTSKFVNHPRSASNRKRVLEMEKGLDGRVIDGDEKGS